jgi:hypothetical protein
VELSPSRTSTAEKAVGKVFQLIKNTIHDTDETSNSYSFSKDSKLEKSLLTFLEQEKANESGVKPENDNLGVSFICGDIFDPMNIPIVDVYFIAIGRKGRNELIPKLLAAIKEAHLYKTSNGTKY